MLPHHIKVYFNCGGYYDRAWAVRAVEPGIAPWRTAFKESVRGPSKADRGFGLVEGFDPLTRAAVTRNGKHLTVDMDSRTFRSGIWRGATGGAAAVRTVEHTLRAIDPSWTVEFRIDGVRLCEFVEGGLCDD